MSNNQNPNYFFTLYKNGQINIKALLDYILTIIEKSENLGFRIKGIEILTNLNLKNERIYNLIENMLVSDESHVVRALSFKYLLKNYYKTSQDLLKWAISKDNSTLFLKEIEPYLKLNEYTLLFKLFDQRIEKISKGLRINSQDAHFLIDLGIELNSVSLILTNFEILYIQNENMLIMVKNERIIELNIVLKLKSIPESIGNLTELEVLNLGCNELSSLPENMKNLKNLKILDLSWNNFDSIPTIITKLPSIKMIDLDHNFLKEIPELDLISNKIHYSFRDNPIS